MLTKPRFRRKIWGRGRTPSTRQGRLVVGAYLAFIIWRTIDFTTQYPEGTDPTKSELIRYLIPLLRVIGSILLISSIAGEKPHRSRGNKKSSDDKDGSDPIAS